MAGGVIPDPYLDRNEAALRWMYGIDWRYTTSWTCDVLDPATWSLTRKSSLSSTASTLSGRAALNFF